ncbi:prenyltransferase/squalene oxidase repeat-containing protein [Pendulispora albinea]|uniref:Squalene cyclase C-terminal domain-containing protein n=1 Tax=Pendulispora albinea TaxID=2741071 RepID=A0ABZ2MBP1_9BACT
MRALQSAEGYWLAEWRSLAVLVAYGTALVACGHHPKSPVLSDICDQIETYAKPGGGLAHCPESDAQPQVTYDAWLLLRHCRPDSRAVRAASLYLKETGPLPLSPSTLMQRWILEPSARAEIANHRPPRPAVRDLLAAHVTPRLVRAMSTHKALERGSGNKQFARLFSHLATTCVWPSVREKPYALSPPSILGNGAALLALQQRAGSDRPLSAGHEASAAHLVPYLERYLYPDGSTYYLLFAPPLLEYLRAYGREEDAKRFVGAIERVGYRAGGYVRTTMVATNVIETSLTVLAMLELGAEEDDPAIVRACEFLHRARTPSRIWSWSWESSSGSFGHRDSDSDDSGAALMALQRAKSPYATAHRDEIVSELFRFQHEGGGLLTMDPSVWLASPLTPSNNSRAIQGLLGLGVSPEDPRIVRACQWLLEQQKPDGSWFDFWISGATYGTTLALEALVAAGYRSPGDPEIERALYLFVRTQNNDGGWGFDWYGTRTRESNVEHTAMAVYGLCKFSRPSARPMNAIEGAMRFLLEQQNADGSWPSSYVCNYSGWEGYTSSHYASVFALRAIAAYLELSKQHLLRAPQLVRNRRIQSRKMTAT